MKSFKEFLQEDSDFDARLNTRFKNIITDQDIDPNDPISKHFGGFGVRMQVAFHNSLDRRNHFHFMGDKSGGIIVKRTDPNNIADFTEELLTPKQAIAQYGHIPEVKDIVNNLAAWRKPYQ